VTEKAFARALWVQALAAASALALSAAATGSLAVILAVGGLAALVMRVLGRRLSRRLESVVGIVALGAALVDMALQQFEIAPALARFLVVLQLAKLLGPRERRDEGTILVVALVHIAVAASSTIDPIFAPLLIVYGAAAAYALALRTLRGIDLERPANPPVPFSFKTALAAIGTLSLGITAILFFTIPRVGAKLLPIPRGPTDRVSGYSDSIALDDTGRIRQSGRRAFRVDVIQRGRLPVNPLWRGQALSEYDGSTWSPTRVRDRIAHEFTLTNGVYDMEVGEPPPDATVLEFYLEPMQSQALFTPPGLVHTIEYKTPGPPIIIRDAFGAILSYWFNSRPTGYRVTCEPREVLPASYLTHHNVPQHTPESKVRELCLKLPRDKLDVPRLKAEAEKILRQSGAQNAPPTTKARVLADYLQNNYTYTLDAKKTPGAERVTDFLFTTKEGHCEVFAGALAVLLRSIDVPARVVNGFRGGEYHQWTDTYTVADKDAHAWVEALGEKDWITLDPTPGPTAEELNRTGLLATLEDVRVWLEIRWFKNVVAFDTQDQWRFLADTKEWLTPRIEDWKVTLGETARHKKRLMALASLLMGLLIAATAMATIGPKKIRTSLLEALATVRERLRQHTPAELAALELEPVVRALERAGVKRGPGETAKDLASRAVERLGERARPFEQIVPSYYAARYGGRSFTDGERQAIREAAQAIER
jgi:transglutaminase-like putative cysteine protease